MEIERPYLTPSEAKTLEEYKEDNITLAVYLHQNSIDNNEDDKRLALAWIIGYGIDFDKE